MKLKECSPDELASREDRAIAKLARIARGDTVHGGAKALVLAKRLNGMNSQVPADEVVGEVYSLSNYTCGRFGAYECPECGSAHLGTEAAYACCAESEGDEE